ncbi:transcription initiation factor TFIID subunit 4-like [Phacochoerus africanus]|uniref:transcription initiation factor TFIID subunit 4-like n=1 Tax=Phacochoerus africanus TaxID=41426 RepID=UPI001FD9E72B|nr:transcription initiation factor TFIID subunit 4-like [Phacochoerus africanus]
MAPLAAAAAAAAPRPLSGRPPSPSPGPRAGRRAAAAAAAASPALARLRGASGRRGGSRRRRGPDADAADGLERAQQLPGGNGKEEPQMENKKPPGSPHRLRLPGGSAPAAGEGGQITRAGGSAPAACPGPPEPRPTAAAAANGRRERLRGSRRPSRAGPRPAAEDRGADHTRAGPAALLPRPARAPAQAPAGARPAPGPPPAAVRSRARPPAVRARPCPQPRALGWTSIVPPDFPGPPGPAQTLPPAAAPGCHRVPRSRLALALSRSLADLADPSARLVPPPRRPRDRSPVEIREVETGPRQELGAGVGGEGACGARCWSLEASQRIFGLHRDRPLLSGPAPFGSKEGSGGGLSDHSSLVPGSLAPGTAGPPRPACRAPRQLLTPFLGVCKAASPRLEETLDSPAGDSVFLNTCAGKEGGSPTTGKANSCRAPAPLPDESLVSQSLSGAQNELNTKKGPRDVREAFISTHAPEAAARCGHHQKRREGSSSTRGGLRASQEAPWCVGTPQISRPHGPGGGRVGRTLRKSGLALRAAGFPDCQPGKEPHARDGVPSCPRAACRVGVPTLWPLRAPALRALGCAPDATHPARSAKGAAIPLSGRGALGPGCCPRLRAGTRLAPGSVWPTPPRPAPRPRVRLHPEARPGAPSAPPPQASR